MAESERQYTELTRESIQRLSGVHSYDSFGRALVDSVLREAAEQFERRPLERIELQLPITVRPVSREIAGDKVCVTVCISVNDTEICIQVCSGE